MESEYMAVEELSILFRSKKDLYKLLTEQSKPSCMMIYLGDFFLPKMRNTDVEFMRQIISGEKKALKRFEVHSFVVPFYQELTVQKIWNNVKDLENVNCYFPDFPPGKLPERDYLMTIISTLYPDITKQLIIDAQDNRCVKVKADPGELIKVSSEMRNEINAMIPMKTTKGVTRFLMKAKAKLKRPRKKPVEYQANFGLLKKNNEDKQGISYRPQDYNDSRIPVAEMEEDKNEKE